MGAVAVRVGIDSYSYHRRYGELRAGESAAPGLPWPLVPAPVLEHARGLAVDDLFLETCYLPEPERIDAAMLDCGETRVGFSWGHPWPEGAFHGLDVPLVFGNLDRGQPAMLIGEATSEAEGVSARMRTAWTSFAEHGDPGWPAYGTDRRLVQCFDVRSAVTPDPEEASRLIWQRHTFAPLGLIDL